MAFIGCPSKWKDLTFMYWFKILRPYPWHMESLGLGVESKPSTLQLQQCWILSSHCTRLGIKPVSPPLKSDYRAVPQWELHGPFLFFFLMMMMMKIWNTNFTTVMMTEDENMNLKMFLKKHAASLCFLGSWIFPAANQG